MSTCNSVLKIPNGLSQQTILLTYASERVTSRGASGQPDIKEKPGFQLDFVAREGFTVWGKEAELKVRSTQFDQHANIRNSRRAATIKIFYNRYKQGDQRVDWRRNQLLDSTQPPNSRRCII